MLNDRQIGRRCRRTSSIAAAIVGLVAGLGSLTVAAPELAAQQAAKNVVFTQPTYSSPIALSADNRLVWSVNPDDNSVSIVRTDNNSLLMTIKVGNEPQSVALDPNNKFAFVANAAGSSVTVIKITNSNPGGFAATVEKTLKTGAEPWNIVTSPDGKRVFVANSGQDTITVINALTRQIIGQVDLRKSLCNDPNRNRHFQPRGLAVTLDNTRLYVTRFLSFTKDGGVQGDDAGKEGVVCRLNINTSANGVGGYQPAAVIRLGAELTGFAITGVDGTEINRLPQPAPKHRDPRQSGLSAQHRGLARGSAAVPELDGGLRQLLRPDRRQRNGSGSEQDQSPSRR